MSLMFEILLTHRAIKDLQDFPESDRVRIVSSIKYFSQDPIKYARKLVDPKIGTYRWRIGD